MLYLIIPCCMGSIDEAFSGLLCLDQNIDRNIEMFVVDPKPLLKERNNPVVSLLF